MNFKGGGGKREKKGVKRETEKREIFHPLYYSPVSMDGDLPGQVLGPFSFTSPGALAGVGLECPGIGLTYYITMLAKFAATLSC